MPILRILEYPNHRLRTVAKAVAEADINTPYVQQMIDDMLETLENTPHCAGLASTQLDIAEPLRIFVFYDEIEQDKPVAKAVINPEIVATEGEVFESEGCMSVYPNHIQMKVKRPQKTTMKYLNRLGNVLQITREGFLAKVPLHEIDHLNGFLCIDRVDKLKRKMLEMQIQKLIKRSKRSK